MAEAVYAPVARQERQLKTYLAPSLLTVTIPVRRLLAMIPMAQNDIGRHLLLGTLHPAAARLVFVIAGRVSSLVAGSKVLSGLQLLLHVVH